MASQPYCYEPTRRRFIYGTQTVQFTAQSRLRFTGESYQFCPTVPQSTTNAGRFASGGGAALPCAGEIHRVVAEVGAPDNTTPVGVVAQLEHEGAGVAQDEVVRWDGQPAVAPLDPQRRSGVRLPSEEPQLRLRVGGAVVLRLQARTRGVGWGRTLSKGSGTKLLLLFRACHHAVPSISAELLGFAAAAMTLASFATLVRTEMSEWAGALGTRNCLAWARRRLAASAWA